ncbi:hypothetical protein MLD38_018038 [Melastoma candidum]|uniref:Uncharacterized protein n=1 Tax=Melastoma candidum TaxID=119954 RepID=A0ACB9QSI9_9MYRT|nr:hypothetical protein MLD38_018038 [Melastoma candidum]
MNSSPFSSSPSCPKMINPMMFFLVLLILCCLSTASGDVNAKFIPKRLVLPITKHPSNQLHTTIIHQRTPLIPVKLFVHLGGPYPWVHCDNYVSSSYKPVPCGSPTCEASWSGACTTECYSPPSPGCHNNSCSNFADDPVTISATMGEMAEDAVALLSTNGRNPGRVVSFPSLAFTCGGPSLQDGAVGSAGFGRSNVSIPVQLASAFRFPAKFAICLSSSTASSGVVFFGKGPYVLLPNVDVSKSLIHTPLVLNPVSTASAYFGEPPSTDYFINVTSIEINGKAVKINARLLNIVGGYGGTKISTARPYTVLETSIFKAVVGAFIKEANLTRVSSVSPFGACFSTRNVPSTRVGPAVPVIDLVLHEKSTYWRIFGANSMVQVKKGVMCLGFVNGGSEPRTSIVIGGHQLEDNLLQFDLVKFRLGFSSSLLFKQTTCGNFNFTSTA